MTLLLNLWARIFLKKFVFAQVDRNFRDFI